ncbi:MAG: hypothetical protein VB032_07160 [Burkholderiaceae bacterium]|nr:hypothetical protein [Burkholderiaceae bacterium]
MNCPVLRKRRAHKHLQGASTAETMSAAVTAIQQTDILPYNLPDIRLKLMPKFPVGGVSLGESFIAKQVTFLRGQFRAIKTCH